MESGERKVPEVVIKRLPRYYRYLDELKKQGTVRISSNALSRMMNVTASQIRQDLNYFGGFGQQGFGYNVTSLAKAIEEILGLNDRDTMIIVGAGNLGRALAKHNSFLRRGFRLIGIFDNDEKIIGTKIGDHTVLPSSDIPKFVRDNGVDIAILTLPKTAVHDMAALLVKSGIKGLMNFSYTELDVPNNIPVENIHLSDSLMTLAYSIKREKENI